MTIISVPAVRQYEVHIGSGLLARCGSAVSPGSVCAIVTDDTVDALYRETVEKSLRDAGSRSVTFVFPHGEAGKSGETYLRLLEFLAQHHLTRSDAIFALGGGVPGDLAGFAAATYLRGIALVQLPTTLLAAVDSSVGGKTGIDLRAGKNLAGAFYQPSAVLCDPDALDTLPEVQLRAGCAEVIKYAMLQDADFFASLLQSGFAFEREAVIARCVAMKRDFVLRDEFDRGCRQLLNFGHSVGHAIEALSGFTIFHGQAVAMGMAAITRASCAAGLCSAACVRALEDILARFALPIRCPYSAEAVCAVMASDKKRRGNELTLVVPRAVGQCALHTLPLDALTDFVKAGIL